MKDQVGRGVLNLEALRRGIYPRWIHHSSHFPRVFGDGSETLMSRREVLQLAGATVFTGALPSRQRLIVAMSDGALHFNVDGIDRWTIDPARFSGQPRLQAVIERSAVRFALEGGLFPGTSISADLEGHAWMDGGRWLMKLAFSLGRFETTVPLVDWLLGAASARSRVNLGATAVDLDASHALVLAGRADALFSPRWSFAFDGASVASVRGFESAEIASHSVALSVADAHEASLFDQPASHRSLIVLDAGQRKWPLPLNVNPDSEWSVKAPDGLFDVAHIELAEGTSGARQGAVLLRNTGPSPAISFCAGDRLRSIDGSPLTLPLAQPRYAASFDDTGWRASFMADFEDRATWGQARGIGLQFGPSNGLPFEVTTVNGGPHQLSASPSLLQVSAPLGDAAVAAGPVPICGAPPITLDYHGLPGFFDRLKCWLGLCDSSELCVPMHGSTLSVLRHADLLRLDFEFRHLGLRHHRGRPRLVRLDASGQPAPDHANPATLPEALLIVRFPPQHIYEEAFDEESLQPPRTPPVQARLSGPSRIALVVPDLELEYSLDTLLDFGRFNMKLVSTAVGPGERPAGNETSKPVTPSPEETALELPYRLYLSPNKYAGWANRRVLPDVFGGTRIDLWHARLGIRQPDGTIDERESARRTLRAVWSEDYTNDPCLPPKAPQNVAVPFLGSLSPRDRIELVELTSNFSLKDATDPNQQRPYRADPVAADLVMLSAMGGWLKSTGQWTPPLTARRQALTVELWKHIATMGRDQYVRVEYKGCLMPYGHPCTLIKITERKFVTLAQEQGSIAFLRQRLFIQIKREETKYCALGQKDGARRWPFLRVIFEKNYTTPNLYISGPQDEFWPQTIGPNGPQDFQFRYKVEDLDGTIFDCASPLKFVDATVAYSECTADDLKLVDGQNCGEFDAARSQLTPALSSRLGGAIDEYNATANEARRTVSFLGRKVAYAPSRRPGDTQLETHFIRLWAEKQDPKYACVTLFAADQPPIYPAIKLSHVDIGAVSALAGSSSTTDIEFDHNYVAAGFAEGANRGEMFVQCVDQPVRLSFGGSSLNADKCGAVVTPNINVFGVSRKIGPVGARSKTSLDVTAQAHFDPSDFFASALSEAKILGGIRLSDIIKPFASGVADALEQAPKLIRHALAEVDKTLEQEAEIFRQRASQLHGMLQTGVNAVPAIKARFQPQLDVISGDLMLLQHEIMSAPADDFVRIGHDAALIDLQGKIINAFRTFTAQIEDILRHPQTLMKEEFALLLAQARMFLDQKLSARLIEFKDHLLGTVTNSLDQLTQAAIADVVAALQSAGMSVARSQIIQDAIADAQKVLKTAVADARAAAPTIERGIVVAAQAIDRFNAVREEIRRVTDLARITVDDFGAFRTVVRGLGTNISTDFQTARARFDELFEPFNDPGIPNRRRAYQQLLGSLGQIEDLWRRTDRGTGAFIRAQADLVRSIQALRALVPEASGSTLDSFLIGLPNRFTSFGNSLLPQPVEAIGALLKAATGGAADVARVKARLDDLVLKIRAANAALTIPMQPQKLPHIVELLDRFADATDIFADAADILPLSPTVKQPLIAAATRLDGYVVQVESAIADVQAMYQEMRALADAAPLILQAAIRQQIDELYAPYASYVATIERQAIDITARLLANTARFVTDLLQRLETRAEDLGHLLKLVTDVEQVVAELLRPRAIAVSYTFSPALQNSPGKVFEVIDNGGKNLLVTVRSVTHLTFDGSQARPPELSIRGLLQSFKLNLLNAGALKFVTITFKSIEFVSATGTRPDCKVTIDKVEFDQALTFVKNLEKLLNPRQGAYVNVTPAQVVAGFRFGVPAVRAGGFSMKNLRFDAAITLPFAGDPVRVRYRIADRDNPFALSIGIFGGGGWFAMFIGADGVDETELALEFGLAGDINIGIASGYGRVMGGIYIHYKRGVGTELAGFIDISGHVDVLGLISLTLSVYFALHRLPGGRCFGEADITVKIELFFFDIEVHLHTEKTFAGDSSSLAERSVVGALPDCMENEPTGEDLEDREIDWKEYFAAFAAV